MQGILAIVIDEYNTHNRDSGLDILLMQVRSLELSYQRYLESFGISHNNSKKISSNLFEANVCSIYSGSCLETLVNDLNSRAGDAYCYALLSDYKKIAGSDNRNKTTSLTYLATRHLLDRTIKEVRKI